MSLHWKISEPHIVAVLTRLCWRSCRMKRPSAPLDKGSHQDPAMSISMCMSCALCLLKATFFAIRNHSIAVGGTTSDRDCGSPFAKVEMAHWCRWIWGRLHIISWKCWKVTCLNWLISIPFNCNARTLQCHYWWLWLKHEVPSISDLGHFGDETVGILVWPNGQTSRTLMPCRDELAAAARLLLRAIRVVVVDVTKNQDTVGEFGIVRHLHEVLQILFLIILPTTGSWNLDSNRGFGPGFPTLLWMQGQSGSALSFANQPRCAFFFSRSISAQVSSLLVKSAFYLRFLPDELWI